MSVSTVTSPPWICSGATYATVPSISPVVSRSAASNAGARPKSVTFTRPSGAIRMFPGLTSRWTMPAACAQSSAESTAIVTSAAAAGSSAPPRTTSASV